MTRRWKQYTTAIVMIAASPALAQQPPVAAQYALPSTQSWDMTSDAGATYRIMVSYPAAEAPEGGYPVLYVLDGNAMFAMFAETRRLQEFYEYGKAIIVGVGYPTDQAYDVRRLDDLTPALPSPPPANLKSLAQYKSGGHDRFLDFLTGKLRAEIGRRYKINPERQSLFGHSLGGLFGLHTLFTRPTAFHSIVAASPSIEWIDQEILGDERAFTAKVAGGKAPRTSRLMVVVGGRDVDDDPEPARAMVARLDLLSGQGMRARLRRYEEEGHMGVPTRAVMDTLRFVFEQR